MRDAVGKGKRFFRFAFDALLDRDLLYRLRSLADVFYRFRKLHGIVVIIKRRGFFGHGGKKFVAGERIVDRVGQFGRKVDVAALKIKRHYRHHRRSMYVMIFYIFGNECGAGKKVGRGFAGRDKMFSHRMKGESFIRQKPGGSNPASNRPDRARSSPLQPPEVLRLRPYSEHRARKDRHFSRPEFPAACLLSQDIRDA